MELSKVEFYQINELKGNEREDEVYMPVFNGTYEVLVTYTEKHGNYSKWLKWFQEANIFD